MINGCYITVSHCLWLSFTRPHSPASRPCSQSSLRIGWHQCRDPGNCHIWTQHKTRLQLTWPDDKPILLTLSHCWWCQQWCIYFYANTSEGRRNLPTMKPILIGSCRMIILILDKHPHFLPRRIFLSCPHLDHRDSRTHCWPRCSPEQSHGYVITIILGQWQKIFLPQSWQLWHCLGNCWCCCTLAFPSPLSHNAPPTTWERHRVSISVNITCSMAQYPSQSLTSWSSG